MLVTVYSNEEALNWCAKDDERIIQNVRNLLRTRQSEIPFMPYVGVNHGFVDTTEPTFKSEIKNHVTAVINAYEPRATVVDVRIESFDENGECVIAVELEV